jgi:hypothetical protein
MTKLAAVMRGRKFRYLIAMSAGVIKPLTTKKNIRQGVPVQTNVGYIGKYIVLRDG